MELISGKTYATIIHSIVCIIFIIINISCESKGIKPRWVPSFIPKVVALEYLPKTPNGYTDWVKALQEGIIAPRDSIDIQQDNKSDEVLDLDIHFKNTKGGLLSVIFPHYPHTQWLNCNNCHPEIFKKKTGSNPINMKKIVRGEYCGRCHGKVAFPLNDCLRCHSGPIIQP